MRTITCHCEQTFKVDLPEIVDLDADPSLYDAIQNGSFLTCICPVCNTTLKTDLKTRINWVSKKACITLLPESDRIAYLTEQLPEETDSMVVIGYAELAERISILKAQFNPMCIEILKYHLLEKAISISKKENIEIFFDCIYSDGSLEFHIHGLKEAEIAVTRIPLKLYDTIQADYQNKAEPELYSALLHRNYLSYQNILLEDSSNV